jgi:tetratricopeptide (TPR) repeat protein
MQRILIISLLCFSASVVFAKTGAVRTRDGRTIEGDITEKNSEVVITTKAGSLTLSLTDVASITYAASIKEQYQQRVAALPKGAGAKTHVDLARWLYDNKEYDLARTELDKALELDANNSDAFALKQAVERSMIWDRAKQKTPASSVGESATTRPAAKDRRVLDADQINAIRQAELKESDRPRVRIDADLRRRYIQHAGLQPAKFALLPDGQKALEILKNGTPEMRRDLRILSDPAPLLRFKTRIQPIVLNGCATASCHGGPNAGTFQLYNPAENEAATYTNFYILTQYNPHLNGAIRKSIDRQQPSESLLVHFGLPREQAQFVHPQVQGWIALFRTTRDPKCVELIDWVQSLVPLAPEYGIAFPLPGGGPTTQPVADEKAAPDAPATQPQPTRKPADNKPAKGDDTEDVLKEIRGRMRPIRGL